LPGYVPCTNWVDGYLRVNAELQYPEHPLGGSREVYANPLAPEGLVRLKSWIDRCVSDHADCALGKNHGQPLQSFVPTRLIKLGNNSSSHVQLVSIAHPVQYVALSYCWGTTKQPGTNQSNISSRQHRINVSELPKTLQDAILVTHVLGFQYIWIDSLCIVQDDVNDWATESSKMADIYSAACLVVAATRSDDCAAGFLQDRSEPLVLDWTLPSEISSRSTAHCMTSLEITARITTSHECFDLTPSIASQPLPRRAWAMQERELARRIVHFLPDEILWHCQTKSFCECGLSTTGYRTLSSFSAFSSLVPDDLDKGRVPGFGSAWIDMLKDYSKLNITKLTDILPALSGMARYVEHLHPGQYIAGMWEKDIAVQLAWARYGNHDRSTRSINWPSFSWVSAYKSFWWDISPQREYKARCTFVAATQLLATANPYGHVLECSVTLRGRTIQGAKLLARINRKRRKDGLPGKMFAVMDDDKCDLHRVLLDLDAKTDVNEHISTQPSVVCFELYQSKNVVVSHPEDTIKLMMTALVLQRCASETSYTRIGLVSNVDPTWFDKDGAEETITIV
jgi:hypothetical protein